MLSALDRKPCMTCRIQFRVVQFGTPSNSRFPFAFLFGHGTVGIFLALNKVPFVMSSPE